MTADTFGFTIAAAFGFIAFLLRPGDEWASGVRVGIGVCAFTVLVLTGLHFVMAHVQWV